MITKSISIIIPLYNEERTAKILLEKVDKVKIPLKKEIIIIESNSIDGTKEIVKKFSEKRKDTRVIYEKKPEGKGEAVIKGLKLVTSDIIIIQDGDLEYDVNEYPRLIEPFIKQNAKVVFGSRHLGMQKWKIRSYKKDQLFAHLLNMGHVIYTTLFNVLYGTKMTDPATMYKLFRRELIQGKKFKTRGFDFDWELTAKLVKEGNKVIEVPVHYISRSRKEGKKIRFFRDGIKVLIAIIRFRMTD